ncbi:MAG: hypothetical protein LBR12_02775 [Opitutaceae bacterium]|nr:hypothetical protein [Opitutaceae bacterium]
MPPQPAGFEKQLDNPREMPTFPRHFRRRAADNPPRHRLSPSTATRVK